MKNPLEILQDILQYPQSVVTGIAAAAPGMHGNARKTTGDLSYIEKGLKGGLRPSDVMLENDTVNYERSKAADFLRGIGELGTDIAFDPTLAVGGMGTKLPGQAGKLAGSATTFGKLADDAGKADKAAQAARYLYQGLMAGGGDVSTGLGVAGLMPVGERVAGRVGAKLFSRAGTQIADDLVGNGLDKKFTQTGLDKVESEYQNALRLLGNDMPEASLLGRGVDVEGPGFSMQSKGNLPVPYEGGLPVPYERNLPVPYEGGLPVPYEGNLPVVDKARSYLRAYRMIGPAPTATLSGVPKGTAVEQYIQELGPLPIQQTPTSYGAMDIQQFGPKPQALPAPMGGEPIPVGPGIQPGQTSPFVSRPPGMDPDVEMLKQVLADAIRQRNKAPLALNAGRSPQEELFFKLAGGM